MSHQQVSSADPGARRRSEPRQAIVEQMELLVDEAEALRPLLGALPDEFIHGRPFDGTPTIGEMLLEIVRLDRTVRRADLQLFLQDGEAVSRFDEPRGPEPDDGDPVAIGEILERLAAARRELVDLVREVSDRAWDSTGLLDGEVVTPLEYLLGVVQNDSSILRAIAERVYESRPMRSPGFTSQ